MTLYARLTRLQFIQLWIAGFVFLGAASLSFALMPDSHSLVIAGGDKPSETAVVAALKIRMAEAKKNPLLRINWDTKRGIPASVHGADLLQGSSAPKGKGVGVAAAPDFSAKAVDVMRAVAGLYGIQNAGQEFSFQSLESSATGYRHVRLNQTYQGLPVFGGQMVVHFDGKGTARSVNGVYQAMDHVAISPVLTPDEAAAVAMADQKAMGKNDGRLTEGPSLVIYARDVVPLLAYQLVVSYGEQQAVDVGRWRYWINAQDGSILLRYNDIPEIAAPAVGVPEVLTGYALIREGMDSTTVQGWKESNGLRYMYSAVNRWYVKNAGGGPYAFAPDAFTYAYRPTADWAASDYGEMSAARAFENIQNYYLTVHGRDSFDNVGGMARVDVHYSENYANAFWNGTYFTFGDGDGKTSRELSVLDVAAHEFQHGVTEHSARLVYAYESGALNESFSDIFGALVEFDSQLDGGSNYPVRVAGTADWLIGEDCWLSSTAMRDMRNPANSNTVGVAGMQPTRYKGTFWYSGDLDSGGVHYNSSVQNFFFYLLCEGGYGVNDSVITYNVPGLGRSVGEKLAYLALTGYITPHTDYTAASEAWLNAAMETDELGDTTNAVASVKLAWVAVGLGTADYVIPEDDFGSGGDPGGGPYLPSNKVYTVINPADSNVTWSVATDSPALWLDILTPTIPLVAGEMGSVEVSINQSVAATLTGGIYRATLIITNNIGVGNTTRQIVLRVGNNYTICPISYDWVDPVAGGHTLLNVSSGVSTSQAIPFPVRYYDSLYSNIYVSAYGMAGFVSNGMASDKNVDLRNMDAPNGMICPLWSVVEGAAAPGQVYYGLPTTNLISTIITNEVIHGETNEVTNTVIHVVAKELVVTWLNVPHKTEPTATFSFQIRIPWDPSVTNGANNDIVIQYKDVAETNRTVGSGIDATIGIEDELGILNRKYSFDGERWLANERALLFTQYPTLDTKKPAGTLRTWGGSRAKATFEIKFDETVDGLDLNRDRISLSDSTVSNIIVGNITGGGMRYFVDVINLASLGRVTMNVLSDAVGDMVAPVANSNDALVAATYVVPIEKADFTDNFELGPGQWIASTQVFAQLTTRAWEWGVPSTNYVDGPSNTVSGSHCWGTVLTGEYPNSMGAWVMSPLIQVGTGPTLDFYVWHNFEYVSGPADFGFVEVYNGTAWINVTPRGYYSGMSAGWIRQQIALDDAQFGNRQIRVRFRATSDSSGARAGMYVDDLKITSQRVPGLWVSSYTPTNIPAGTTTQVVINIYNSSTAEVSNVNGNVSSPDTNVLVIGGNPLVYGTILPGDFATAPMPVQLQVAAPENFPSPRVILYHQGMIGTVPGNLEGLPLIVDGVTISGGTNVVTVRTLGPIKDWLGRTLQGDGGATSCLFQVISAGSGRINDAPLSNGQVMGDDVLLYSSDMLLPWGRFGEGSSPGLGAFRKNFLHNLSSNDLIYVRAWDSSSFESSVAYGDSPLFAITNPAAQLIDFGVWTVGTPIQTNRDSNGDSLPDGWCVLNGTDPRLPIQSLGSRVTSAKAVTSFNHPDRVTVSTNHVFVADTENSRVQVWNRELTTLLYSLGYEGDTNFSKPRGVAVTLDGARLAVADTANRRIRVFSVATNGVLSNLFNFASTNAAVGSFKDPFAVAFKPTGEIVVADSQESGSCSNRIQIFSATGIYQSQFGTAGSSAGKFNHVLGVGLGKDGSIYAADADNNRVQKFDGSGSHKWSYPAVGTASGTATGSFWRVWDAQPSVGGLVYVADYYNNRIQVLGTGGTVHVVGVYSNAGAVLGAISLPRCAVPGPEGKDLYVVDGPNRVMRLTVTLDGDGDGMDDVWEIQHWFNPDLPSDAFGDADGDGIWNIGEFRASMDPGIPLSILSIGVEPAVLSWTAGSGYIYCVQSTTNLVQNNWADGVTVTSSINGPCSFTNVFVNTNRLQFMRVVWTNTP